MMLKRVPSKEELFAAVLEQEAARSKASALLSKEIQKLFDSYFLRVTRFLSGVDSTLTQTMDLQAATQAMNELRNILVKAGYEDVISSYEDQFEHLTKSALKYFELFGVDDVKAGIDVEALQAWAHFTETEFAQKLQDSLVAPIQSALLQSAVGNVDRNSLVQTVLQLSNVASTAQAEVLVDDAFAQYQRAVVTQKAANLDMQIFVYLGPEDKITSPQCEAMLHANKHGVDGMLYADEITVDLHPNLRENPLIAGGHPRCRHHWSPVSESYAESLGFQLRQANEN